MEIFMKIAICDDEVIFHNNIQALCIDLLKDYALEFQYFFSGDDFLQSNSLFDILFLDIEMTGIDGISVKDQMSLKHLDTKIIFSTYHEERMIEAFGENVIGFLTKPVQKDAITLLIDKFIKFSKKNLIEWNDANKHYSICIDNIDYIEAQDKYTNVICGKDAYLIRRTMKEWENCLPQENFCRVNRSLLVHMKLFDKIGNLSHLKNGLKVQISRKYKESIIEKYKIYIRKKAGEL